MHERKHYLTWLAGWIFLIIFGWLYLHSPSLQVLSRCLLYETTGLLCPLCGGTRAAQALLALDFATVTEMNVLIYIYFPLVGFTGFYFLSALTGRNFLSSRSQAVSFSLWLFFAVVVVFTVWRNLF